MSNLPDVGMYSRLEELTTGHEPSNGLTLLLEKLIKVENRSLLFKTFYS